MAFPPDDSWFRKFIEDQKRFEKLISPIHESILQYQKLLDSTNLPALEYQKSILEQASIRDYLSIAGVSKDFLSMQQEIQNSLCSIDSFAKSLERLKESTRFDSILAAQENLYRFQDQFIQTRNLLQFPSTRIESVLAAAETTSRIFHASIFLSEFTLSSVAEYQFFLYKQYKLIKQDSELIADRRLQIADLSGGLFELINASIDIGVVLDGQGEYQNQEVIESELFESRIYGHVNQHLGFAYSKSYSGDIEESFNKSIPARISCLGYAITEQIYKINSICESKGQGHIFKPTSRTMRACATVPSLIARSENDFHFLIDNLYFLLYEGSSAASRLVPILSEQILEPLWKVKHLRLSARHDIDHGSSRDIEKNREKINNTYISLIARPLPIKQGDWQKAQLQIYVEIDLMLQNIIQELMKSN